jgi:signal transduction histidine kinase
VSASPPLRARIWIVDDSATELEMARRALETRYSVDSFADGASLLERLASAPVPELLVLDWVMPGVSGMDVCHFLRAQPSTERLPILILTSYGATEDLVAALGAGANDFVTKPFSPAELAARAAALLRTSAIHERALAAEVALGDVLQQLPEALIAVDAEGQVVYANPEADSIFASAPGGLLGRAIRELSPALAELDLSAAPAPTSRPDLKVHDRLYAPLVRVLPLGERMTTAISFRDVTDERQQSLRRLDFYSMVAHDLRTPLTALLLRIDMLLSSRRGEAAPLLPDLEKMRSQVDEMRKLIGDFLDLASIDGIGVRLERSSIDAAELVREVIDTVGPLLSERQLDLGFEPSADIRLLGDRRRLAQVLVNLVANAAKFTPPGGHIGVHVGSSGEQMEVRVSDTGAGIPPEVLANLFNRFERGSAPASVSGTGLGLMIVREIIEAHGGSVGAESELGQGSTFWFRLPQTTAPAEARS